jgi:hypothetical protein
VIDAVHAEGGKIAPQLWRVGGIRRAGSSRARDTPGYIGYGIREKLTGHDAKKILMTWWKLFVQAAIDADVSASMRLSRVLLDLTVTCWISSLAGYQPSYRQLWWFVRKSSTLFA